MAPGCSLPDTAQNQNAYPQPVAFGGLCGVWGTGQMLLPQRVASDAQSFRSGLRLMLSHIENCRFDGCELQGVRIWATALFPMTVAERHLHQPSSGHD